MKSSGRTKTKLRRLGYTLLEVIIASTLVATLMVLAWSLFRTYTKLEQKGAGRIVTWQLIRSLQSQLQSDISHLAVTPPELPLLSPALLNSITAPPSLDPTRLLRERDVDEPPFLDRPEIHAGPSTAADFRIQLPEHALLRGTADRLELLVRLPHRPRDVSSTPFRPLPRYGMWQQVVYQWHRPPNLLERIEGVHALNLKEPSVTTLKVGSSDSTVGDLRANDSTSLQRENSQLVQAPVYGLVRELKNWDRAMLDQRRWEMSLTMTGGSSLTDGTRLEPGRVDEPFSRQSRDGVEVAGNPADRLSIGYRPPRFDCPGERDHLPEIVLLQFRYSDGTNWQTEWTSVEGKLPVAIEVAFNVDAEAPFLEEKLRGLSSAELELRAEQEEERLRAEEENERRNLIERVDMQDPTALRADYRFVLQIQMASDFDASQELEQGSAPEPIRSRSNVPGPRFGARP